MSDEVVYLSNHAHLIEALANNPGSNAYFPSKKIWKEVGERFSRDTTLRVLIRPNSSSEKMYCTFVADLTDLRLANRDSDVSTLEARRTFVEDQFGLQKQFAYASHPWAESAAIFANHETFYQLSNVQRIRPINVTSLIKINGGEAISQEYTRSGPILCRSTVEINLEDDATTVPSTEALNEPVTGSPRERMKQAILARRGQREFRDALLRLPEACCAVTGTMIVDVLEAAHIWEYKELGFDDHDINNGILLRSDVHVLFDVRLLTIDPETLTIRIHPSLKESEYWRFDGTQLKCVDTPQRREYIRSRDQKYHG